MKIKKRKVNSNIERNLLIGMIVSDEFLKEATHFIRVDLLENEYARTVTKWCLRYYEKYKKAPNIHISDIFEANSKKMDPDQRALIATLLEGLSEEHANSGKFNVRYLLDQSEELIRSRFLKKTASSIRGHLAEGNIEDAENVITTYKKIGRPETLGGNPFKSPDLFRRAFEASQKPLFTFPGALGRTLNRQLLRDSFIAFLGPEKRGKTWILNECALRAYRARCNTALFQIGDMTDEQVALRLAVRLCKKSNLVYDEKTKPYPILDCKHCQLGECPKGKKVGEAVVDKWSIESVHEAYQSGSFEDHVPCTKCKKDYKFKGSIWWEEREINDPLEWREAFQSAQRLLRRTRGREFKLSVHSSDQISVDGINQILDSWEVFDNFVPDVIVIDYADNLDAESGFHGKEERHKENKKWKMLRRLSQDRHCLVITATQAAGRAYGKASVDMSDYNEDKRKHGHVTFEGGLNQTPEEKRAGVMRIGVVVQREGAFFSDDEVYIAQALHKGQPVVFSFRS